MEIKKFLKKKKKKFAETALVGGEGGGGVRVAVGESAMYIIGTWKNSLKSSPVKNCQILK